MNNLVLDITNWVLKIIKVHFLPERGWIGRVCIQVKSELMVESDSASGLVKMDHRSINTPFVLTLNMAVQYSCFCFHKAFGGLKAINSMWEIYIFLTLPF